MSLAPTPRLIVSQAVDFFLVLLVGLALTLLEALLLDDPARATSTGVLDFFAGWLHTHAGAALHGAIAAMLFALAYSLALGRSGGRTLGRVVTGTVLVRLSGAPITWRVISIRTAAILFSAAPFGAGFLWAIVNPRGRTWHDIVAGTIVVKRHLHQ